LRSSKRRISASSADVGAGGADAGVALEHAVGQAGELSNETRIIA
jgi:hypothetical protein